MSEKEYKEKSENLFMRNTILINENERLQEELESKTVDLVNLYRDLSLITEAANNWENLANGYLEENQVLKSILLAVMEKHDICSLCESKGQYLPECTCMKNDECLIHIQNLWRAK